MYVYLSCTYLCIIIFAFIVVAPYEAAVVGETLYSKGDRLILNCTSEGGPQLEYYWLFLEDVISNSSMIIINSVNTSHIGNYTCIVTNDAGSDNDTITVYGKSSVSHLASHLSPYLLALFNGF